MSNLNKPILIDLMDISSDETSDESSDESTDEEEINHIKTKQINYEDTSSSSVSSEDSNDENTNDEDTNHEVTIGEKRNHDENNNEDSNDEDSNDEDTNNLNKNKRTQNNSNGSNESAVQIETIDLDSDVEIILEVNHLNDKQDKICPNNSNTNPNLANTTMNSSQSEETNINSQSFDSQKTIIDSPIRYEDSDEMIINSQRSQADETIINSQIESTQNQLLDDEWLESMEVEFTNESKSESIGIQLKGKSPNVESGENSKSGSGQHSAAEVKSSEATIKTTELIDTSTDLQKGDLVFETNKSTAPLVTDKEMDQVNQLNRPIKLNQCIELSCYICAGRVHRGQKIDSNGYISKMNNYFNLKIDLNSSDLPKQICEFCKKELDLFRCGNLGRKKFKSPAIWSNKLTVVLPVLNDHPKILNKANRVLTYNEYIYSLVLKAKELDL